MAFIPESIDPETSTTVIAVKSTFLCLCILFGVLGNGSVIYAIKTNGKLQTIPNYFVLNLAIADILFTITGMPMILVTTISKEWLFGNFLCDAVGFINSLFCIASIWTLVMISVNRYLNVAKARDIKKIYTFKRTAIGICVVWLFSIFVAMPPLIGWSEFKAGSNFCTINGNSSLSYSAFIVSLVYLLPLIFLTGLYLRIFFLLRVHERNMLRAKKVTVMSSSIADTHSSDNDSVSSVPGYTVSETAVPNKKTHKFFVKYSKQATNSEPAETTVAEKNDDINHNSNNRVMNSIRKMTMKTRRNTVKRFFKETRITKMLLILVISFFLCWTPFIVASMLYAFNAAPKTFRVTTFGIMCACLNSVINPIIYALMNRNFRKAYSRIYDRFCASVRCR